jgi:methylmalonyl-CoA/ethylmalonyl-CoA epimerase
MEEFKSLKIDHIAVAVPNIKEVYPFYEMAGFTDFHDEIVESEKVNTRSMHAGNSKIELIEPISEDSPIKKF